MTHKKCEHGKTKSYCRDCGGSAFCIHDKQKSRCRECGGSQICNHNRLKPQCKLCGGSQICTHSRYKSSCTKCNGGNICEHNKRKSVCTICGGASICVHNRQKTRCIECGGSSVCEHNKNRSECKDCGGSQICIHKRQKSTCIDCGGRNICEHRRIRSQCKECDGSQICKHKKKKSYCKECGGSELCKSEWCETKRNQKYDGYCMLCYIHLFPDRPVARNYKTKERAVVEYVLEQFPPEKYSWIADKRVYNGCSRKRPDLFLDLGYQVIIVEVDENQHEQYDCSCENKRLMELSQDVNHRPLIFIRFNPDDYLSKDGHITSCWAYNKLSVCTIKKTKQKEWTGRLEALSQQITYWLDENHKTDKTVEVIHLFYDEVDTD
jgi:hypothetical protein